MIQIGKLANRETVCILTNMDQPLGYAIGNSLEVVEAVNFLKGEMPEDLKQVVLELGAYMISLAGLGDDIQENKLRMLENIENQKGFKKLLEMVQNQKGDISYLNDISKFEKAEYIVPIKAHKEGYIREIDAQKIGNIACGLGAGRVKKEDKIDYSVGIILNKKVSDYVNKDEIIGYIHANDNNKLLEAQKEIYEIIKISNEKIQKEDTILKIIE